MTFRIETPENQPQPKGFAEGITLFLTVAGLDVLLRTSLGESKGRLSELDADGNLVGSMFEPGADEDSKAINLVATIRSENHISLRIGKRSWELRKPAGKQHYFAFLNQWPTKAEPVSSVKAMLAALAKR